MAYNWSQRAPRAGIMNHLVVCGINYHFAPLAIREQFCIPDSCIGHALEALKRFPHIKESVILSTCNRTEVYAVVDDVKAGMRDIESFIASVQRVGDHDALKPNFKLLRDDVVLHLLRVASGLDSMVLGEGQIMSQVKAAHQNAVERHTAGLTLDFIFKLALSCGKKVRSETSMGRRAVSVSSAAIELARTTLGPLKDKAVSIIGMGKMGQICVKTLLAEGGDGSVILLNRNSERIENFLKNKLNNREKIKSGFAFEESASIAAQSDLIIVSTSATSPVLTKAALARHRHDKSPEQLIVDISVPRNVDTEVATLPGVSLATADDLAEIVSRNLAERESLVSEAEQIVFDQLESYHNWQRSQLVVPTIAVLREKIEAIRLEQMAKTTSSGCPNQESSRFELETISRAIVNQILHHPTVQLKATKDYEILKQQAEALHTLFHLDPLAVGSSHGSSSFGSSSRNNRETREQARRQAAILSGTLVQESTGVTTWQETLALETQEPR